METVFDYNITKEEWKYIRGVEKESYLASVDPDTAVRDIAALFYHRGNEEKARAYSERLPDLVKYDLWRTLTHP